MVELDDGEQFMNGRPKIQTLVCLLSNRREAVFAVSPFGFLGIVRIKITTQRWLDSRFMTLSRSKREDFR